MPTDPDSAEKLGSERQPSGLGLPLELDTTVVAAFFGFHFGAMEAEDSAAPFGFLLQLWLDKITTLLCWAAKRALTTVTEGR